jgi:peptidyl-prolyl cis-trans isomerase SurA
MPLLTHAVSAIAALGLAVSSSPASASQDPTEEVISLKQISLQVPADLSREEQKTRLEAFRVATRGISSCGQVDEIARKLGGTAFYRAEMRIFNLPPPVRLLLASAGPGRATVPYGKAPTVHVLVQCGPSRKVPIRTRPTT